MDMELELIKLEESHIRELTKIMERAFHEDTRIHLGEEKGGRFFLLYFLGRTAHWRSDPLDQGR